jgi:hypothetical protein
VGRQADAQAGQSVADRLHDEAIAMMREFAEEIDKMLRERRLDDIAMCTFRFAAKEADS